jgi:hypothetical protein
MEGFAFSFVSKCNFDPQCPFGIEISHVEVPSPHLVGENHWVACHFT